MYDGYKFCDSSFWQSAFKVGGDNLGKVRERIRCAKEYCLIIRICQDIL